MIQPGLALQNALCLIGTTDFFRFNMVFVLFVCKSKIGKIDTCFRKKSAHKNVRFLLTFSTAYGIMYM